MVQSVESLGPSDAAIISSIIDTSIAGFIQKKIALFQDFCSYELFHGFFFRLRI